MSRQARLLTLALFLLSHAAGGTAQETAGPDATSRQRAAQEVEGVLLAANSITDRPAAVKVRAKAASLLWPQDRTRASRMFEELWQWVEAQDGREFRQEARAEVLKNLFPRDAGAAAALLEKWKADGDGLDSARVNGLAEAMLDDDPATAARLLERSLSNDLLPAEMSLLIKLRKRDVGAANGIAARAVAALGTRPTAEALVGSYTLIEYMSAAGAAPAAAQAGPSDDALRRQFFLASSGTLSRSLQATEQRPQGAEPGKGKDAMFVNFCQAQLAGVLSALAARYAPERADEFGSLSAKLSAGIPPQLAELAKYTAERVNGRTYRPKGDTPADSLTSAVNDGNFDEARRLLGKIEKEDVRKLFAYQIAVGEFKADMARSNLSGALAVAKGVEDVTTRADMFTQVLKAARKKEDGPLGKQVLAEARASFSNAECGGRKAAAMYSLAAAAAPVSLGDAVEFINGGTSCLNTSNASAPSAEGATAADELRKLGDSHKLQQAFSSLGRVDLDNALLSAVKIEDRATALMARLSACEGWLAPAGAKPGTASANVKRPN